jgi:hypothetical protein
MSGCLSPRHKQRGPTDPQARAAFEAGWRPLLAVASYKPIVRIEPAPALAHNLSMRGFRLGKDRISALEEA